MWTLASVLRLLEIQVKVNAGERPECEIKNMGVWRQNNRQMHPLFTKRNTTAIIEQRNAKRTKSTAKKSTILETEKHPLATNRIALIFFFYLIQYVSVYQQVSCSYVYDLIFKYSKVSSLKSADRLVACRYCTSVKSSWVCDTFKQAWITDWTELKDVTKMWLKPRLCTKTTLKLRVGNLSRK